MPHSIAQNPYLMYANQRFGEIQSSSYLQQWHNIPHTSQDTRPPNHSIQPQSHTHPQAEEVHAHLDRKCFVVLSETSSLQLYTYFTSEVKGLHTGVIPQDIASSWAKYQCWCCCAEMSSGLPPQKNLFCFPSTVPEDLIVNLCQLTRLFLS